MIIENLTREELEKFVKSHCVRMIKDFMSLESGQYYCLLDQDEFGIDLIDDEGTVIPFSYEEALECCAPPDNENIIEYEYIEDAIDRAKINEESFFEQLETLSILSGVKNARS